MPDLAPLLLTFRLAGVTTVILLLLSLPLACRLHYTTSRFKPFWETLVSLPLVLPPTVLGFYLLLLLSPSHFLGAWVRDTLNLRLIFSFEGLVIGSLLYSLPFMVQPLQTGFSRLPPSLIEASSVLGKSKRTTFFKILLPNMKKPLLTGIVLSFAHTVGEFGVVLMIGGNIPGKTRTASIAVYNEVEALNYSQANTYSLILLAVTFGILFTVHCITGLSSQGPRKNPGSFLRHIRNKSGSTDD